MGGVVEVMDERQEAELVGLGNCQLHYHEADRAVTHDKLAAMQRIASTVSKSASYVLTENDDIILCTGTATFTLPAVRNTGRELRLVLTEAAATMTIIPTGTDTVQ